MRIACHQPNFIPWFPFFYKMAMVDVFVVLDNVQYEKNGYQNRTKYKDKWLTMPVVAGTNKIHDKSYVNGENVSSLNTAWIDAIRRTLGIETKLESPYSASERGLRLLGHDIDFAPSDPTERLIYIVKNLKGTTYITNETAKDKYLNESKMRASGIDIEYCKVPKHLQISIFEAFEIYGVEGLIKQLPKRELCTI